MDYFPIFLRLTDQPVVVIGGGEVAARKVLLLARAGARITVVAPQLCATLAERVARGELVHRAETFHPEQLTPARLVIAATDDAATNAWVARSAEARQVPVNVVDDRELSRFVMPAIVDRSPVLVAISSSGAAPVLTRRLREQIEALLPTAIGKLARWSAQWRDQVKARLANPDARRRFWERFFDGDIAADVLAGRDQSAAQRIATAIAAAEPAAAPVGEVALVGAGPGDPGLLTLRALRVMQNADVVVYDRLVSAEVLELVRRDAERIYVGKQAGQPCVAQADINQLLVDLARQGKRVCRLKGGDPFVFGRGGEELERLAAHGIRFEVVPGISAAAGCAAYAGIPLTHRDHAQILSFTTGHARADGSAAALDWSSLARPGQTAVFYMGLKGLPDILTQLQAHGLPAAHPAAVVEQGTRPGQRVLLGTLGDLAERVRAAQIASPALLIVGEVTRLHEQLKWFNTATAPAPAEGQNRVLE